jgi:hypothetical protein
MCLFWCYSDGRYLIDNLNNYTRATNKRLTILSEAEQAALYELPNFDDEQRQEYASQASALEISNQCGRYQCYL